VAREALLAYRRRLGPEAVVEAPRAFAGATVATSVVEEEIERVAGRWDPDGVIRVVEALERTGVTSFALEAEGILLRLQRDDGVLADEATSPEPSSDASPAFVEVVAPVLGTFYRRSSPDAAPFAEPGAPVAAGQTICVLEVMKTYHEVTATAAGALVEFLVEDGQFVEYGQAIARIAV
jgi:biotin carboxyl carrier protein